MACATANKLYISIDLNVIIGICFVFTCHVSDYDTDEDCYKCAQ